MRAATAALIAHRQHRNPAALAAKTWPRQPEVAELLSAKAATSPAALANAGALTQSAVQDFFSSLGPASAAAALLDRSVKVSFESHVAVIVPSCISDAGNTGFIPKGAPFPVRSLTISGPTLNPHKLGCVATFSNELMTRSTPDVETIVRTVLSESLALAPASV